MKDEKGILGLSTVRRNRGITLEQISQATKIGVRQLAAIEMGDFRVLPGGIYATSYIRQYARSIDYPEDDILEIYRRHMANPPVASKPARPGKLQGGGLRAASTPANS
jgi:cytoskeleton protein RodZ